MRVVERFGLTVALMIVSAAPVAAADWKVLYLAPNGHKVIELDTASIHRRGTYLQAWIKVGYAANQTDQRGSTFRSQVGLWAYDCDLKRSAIVQLMEYDGANGEGNVVWSWVSSENEYSWEYVPPGGPNEQAMDLICSSTSKTHPIDRQQPTRSKPKLDSSDSPF